MSVDARAGVDAALTVTVNHFEPVIHSRLASHLNGQEWTGVLSGLGRIKSHLPKTQSSAKPCERIRVALIAGSKVTWVNPLLGCARSSCQAEPRQ